MFRRTGLKGRAPNSTKKLREAYLAIAASEPDRCLVIDAGATKEAVAKSVWYAVQSRLDPSAVRRIDEAAAAKV
jgi:dTMP kinase